MSAIIALVLLAGLFKRAESFTIHSAFGLDFEAYCPTKHFVSHLEIHKGEKKIPTKFQGKKFKDIRFMLECSRFLPPEDDEGSEKCRLKARFPMPHGVLLMDNHYKSCNCDEYLAGMKVVTYRKVNRPNAMKLLGEPKLELQRMVQLRCCYSSQRILNITSCYFSGLRYLMAPWETTIRTRAWKEPREAIQTFALNEDYINARICSYLTKGVDMEKIAYQVNKCDGTKKRGLKSMLNKFKRMAEGKCEFPTGDPFGWMQNENSRVDERAVVLRHSRLYKKQMHMCRDGNYIYALYKYARNGTKGKDYIFLTRCHEITYAVCHCSWEQNCTHPEKRKKKKEYKKTFYLGGWRSKWDEEMGRRTIEVLCCKSKGLKMLFCNTTRNFTDRDTHLVINRPRYKWDAFLKPKVIDGEIIRDIDQWYINGSLLLRFNVCRVNGSDGECQKKCPNCNELDLDVAFLEPIPIDICTTTTENPDTVSTTTARTEVTEAPVVVTEATCTLSTETADSTVCQTGGLCECIDFCTTTHGNKYQSAECNNGVCSCSVYNINNCADPQTPCTCANSFDFGYMIDRSTSVGSDNFDLEKQFFGDFTQRFEIGSNLNRVSWITFSTEAETQFTFESTTQSSENVVSLIQATDYPGGWTHITQALQNVQPIFASTQRPGIPQVVLLATDGRHNRGNVLPPSVAAEIRADGAYVFVVAIGPDEDLDIEQLEQVAGSPDSARPGWVFRASFDSLSTVVNEIANTMCSEVVALENLNGGAR